MKRIICIFLVVFVFVPGFLFASGENEKGSTGKEVVTLTTTSCWVGSNSNAGMWSALRELIESKYGDEIKLDVEEIPGKGSEMTEKLRILIMSKQLPDFTFVDSINVLEEAREADLLFDQKPYIQKNMPELYNSLDPEFIDSVNLGTDGWYGITSLWSPMGYFYNTEMFKKANITPAKTWDEWFENAEALQAEGFVPFSMMGAEGGWTTNLYLFNMVNTLGDAGNELCQTRKVTDYNIPEFIEAVDMTKTMFQKYTTEDAVGSGAAQSSAYFLSETTAIFANGPWFIPTFYSEEKAPAGFAERVGWSLFPENSMMQGGGSPWMVAKNSDEKIDAAMKVIEVINGKEGQTIALEIAGVMPTDKSIDVSEMNLNGLQKQIVEGLKELETSTITCWSILPPVLVQVISQQYQALMYNNVTPEQFAANLTDAAMAAE